jgi:hypothetical protein
MIASGPSHGWPTEVRAEEFSRLAGPKLYVSAENDIVDGNPTDLASTVYLMHGASPEPKALRLFPGEAHGAELFDTEYVREFGELRVGFGESLRYTRGGQSHYGR